MTTRIKLIAAIAFTAIALTAAAVELKPTTLSEKSLSPEAAQKIATLETSEADATAKLQAVAAMVLAPIQQQENEVWVAACKDAGFPLAECKPDVKRRVVTRSKQPTK
jgi:hypothetical protein